MTIIVHDMEQNSPSWYAVRLGKPSASVFKSLMAKGEGKMRRALLLKLAGEILTGEPAENYMSADMERGHAEEARIRQRYAFTHNVDPQLVGFIEDTDKRAGCSPDSLLPDGGILEIKSAAAHVLVDRIDDGRFPLEHIAQCQGALWITGRDYIDIAVDHPALPQFVKRALPDKKFQVNLADEVARFNDDLDALVERIRRYGAPPSEVVRDQLRRSVAEPNILMAG